MATIAEQLDEARAAYHALQTGRAAVTVRDSNGEEVSYARATIGRLAAYIRDLERQTGAGLPILSVRFNTSKGI